MAYKLFNATGEISAFWTPEIISERGFLRDKNILFISSQQIFRENSYLQNTN